MTDIISATIRLVQKLKQKSQSSILAMIDNFLVSHKSLISYRAPDTVANNTKNAATKAIIII